MIHRTKSDLQETNKNINKAACRQTNSMSLKSLKKVYVELTTRCNLRCPMCIKASPGNPIGEKDLTLETFKYLLPHLQGIEFLVLNGIGEPLLHPDLATIIHLAATHMPADGQIGFQSNGLLLREQILRELIGAGLNVLWLSMEQTNDGNTDDSLGHGYGDREQHTIGLDIASRVLETMQPAKFRLGVETVISKDNIDQLPAFILYCAGKGVQEITATHIMSYQMGVEEKCLFNPNSADATALFDSYLEKAEKKGIQLLEPVAPIWSRNSDSKTQMHQDLLRTLIRAGREQSISLHLDSLREWQSWNQSEVEDIYKKAHAIARDYRIRLDLPSQQALDERSCPFIDRGTAFITADGEVAPCHALWHDYSCYLDKHAKMVSAKTFGNIKEQNLEDIWNEQKFSEFRQEAGEYRYPYCRSCAVGPCPDVTNLNYPFEYDCYGITVPCGHCMWNLGALRCL